MIVNPLEYYEAHSDKEVVFIFIDAQKVFDRVNWKFMFALLEKMEFGDNFMRVIRSIYITQRAKILINGEEMERIEI